LLQHPSSALITITGTETIRVLHVDDDASILEISKQILLDLNSHFDIDQACCVDDAFKKLAVENYDVVISDYEMPQKDGLQFLKELRGKNNEIPFVLFTGKGREEVAIQALNHGADAYINKQGDPETVYGELTDALVKTIERKTFKRLHAELESKYRKIVEATLQGIIIAQGSPARIVFANSAMGKLFGYSPEELVALAPHDIQKLVHPDDRETFFNRFSQRLAGKEVESVYEVRGIRKDGKIIWLEATGSLIEHNGQPSVQGAYLDITERKRAEQDLKESEEKYKTLFEQAGDYILILEVPLTGVPTIFDANTSALQIHGYTRKEIIGKPITFLDEESGNERVMTRVKKLLNGEKLTFEAKHRRKDGSIIEAEVSIKKVKVASKNFLLSVERDITERKKMEGALRQDQNVLEAITKNIGAGFVTISRDYRVLYANKFVKNHCGNVEGKQCYATLNTLDHICPDCGVKKVFEDGVARDSHEYSHIGIDGKPYYVELIATPLKDKYGNVTAALEFVVDIAEKKRMQQKLQDSEAKFRVINEKLRVVGSLTRHDVGNKLLAVNVCTYLLKKNYADQADIVEALNNIELQVKDSAKIFEFAKMYEQLGVEELKYVDVGNVVNEAAALFSGLTITVVNNCHGVSVLADSFLRQMFYNFIDNTRKYGVKATATKIYYEDYERGGLRLIYEDDGVGISEENKFKLFREGFSTGGSTGFGLFFIKKMMSVYGWTITEESQPGKGAKFVITIPTRPS